MKHGETQTYKGMGTIQMSKNEDGEKCYLYTHFFSGKTFEEDTIKGAREMLEFEERQAEEVRQALRLLRGKGYRVFKEIA